MPVLEAEIPLFLAVPNKIYKEFDAVILKVIQDNKVKLLIFDDESEVVVEWIQP